MKPLSKGRQDIKNNSDKNQRKWLVSDNILLLSTWIMRDLSLYPRLKKTWKLFFSFIDSYPVIRVASKTLLTLTGVVAHGVDAKGIGATCSWFQTFIDVWKKNRTKCVMTWKRALKSPHKWLWSRIQITVSYYVIYAIISPFFRKVCSKKLAQFYFCETDDKIDRVL